MQALFLGGARSGKSAAAEAWTLAAHAAQDAASPGVAPVYLATAEALDGEMAERIAQHRAERDPRWVTVETPQALPAALASATADGAPVLVDCLTLWLSNRLLTDQDLDRDADALIEALASARRAGAPVALVSNEVGLGVVPDTALARRFRDAQGRLNQRVGAAVDIVRFMAAGLPMTLKGPTEARP